MEARAGRMTDPMAYYKENAEHYRKQFLTLEKEHLMESHKNRQRLSEQRAELTMQYENRIRHLECDTRNRVLEADEIAQRHETEINGEKSRRLELQSRVTELEGLHAMSQAENRELRERTNQLNDEVLELKKLLVAKNEPISFAEVKKEEENSPVLNRMVDMSTELRIENLKRDLRMQRSATDEANLAITRLQNHYENNLRRCEDQIIDQEKCTRRY